MENKHYYASFSGGKDSTAMVLRLVEEGYPLDDIIFCDTGLEFPEMYEHIDKVERFIGRKITRVKPQRSFEELMTNYQPKRRNDSGIAYSGLGWPGPKMRWCTGWLKTKVIEKLEKSKDSYKYVGIAADEQYRLKRKHNQNSHALHPLVDWGMSEGDCLKYCYDRGFDWGGLYREFGRVPCWLCPLQPLKDLRVLYRSHPDLWKEMERLDGLAWNQYKREGSVRFLAARFDLEEEYEKEGKSIRSREFYNALKELKETFVE